MTTVESAGTTFPHDVITTEDALDIVVNEIETYIESQRKNGRRAYLYVDAEGRELGRAPDGKLGLLQIGLVHPSLQVYLVDVVTIPAGCTSLHRFFLLLSAPSVVKVLWDAKMDYSELLHGQGVVLAPVLDLQLVEMVARQATQSHDRLFVHKLLGLRHAVDRFEPFSGPRAVEARRIDEVVKPMMRQGDSRVWLERPLSADLCLYAALDIYSLVALHARLRPVTQAKDDGEDEEEEDRLMVLSDRYAALYRDARPRRDDPYTRHGFLPIGILDMALPPDEVAWVCDGCRRSISTRYWHAVALKRIKSGQGALCPVCARVKRFMQSR